MRASLILITGLSVLLAFGSAWAQDGVEQVRLQLMWKHQFQFAGYYMAKEKGFYRDAGLDVELVEMTHGESPVEEVMSGRAQFGVGRSSLLLERLKGWDLVALMAAFQRSPLMLLTLEDSGISDPSQLRGKRVMMSEDAASVGEIIAMLLKFGITADDIELQKQSFNLQDLVEGRTDALAAYMSNEPFQLGAQRIRYNVIHPQDYGFPMYSDILFTSGELADKRFDLVLKFREASLRGWIYAFDHIEESVDTILAKYNAQQRSREALLYEARSLRTLAFDEQGKFGTLSREQFEAMAGVYRITSSVKLGAGLQGFLLCCSGSDRLTLNPFLRHYLRHLGTVRVCTNSGWEPLQWRHDEQYSGLVEDYIDYIFSRIGVEHEMVASDSWQASRTLLGQKRCDLIGGIMPVVPSGDPLQYSRPFVTVPIVAALREGENIAHPLLLPKPVGVLRQHDLDRLLLRRYPELTVIALDSVADGLNRVLRGELSAFIDTRFSIENVIKKSDLHGLVLDQSLNDSFDLGFAAAPAKGQMVRLLDRVVTDIGHEERERILARWSPVIEKKGVDEGLVRNLLIGIAVLALLAGYRFYLVSVTNRRLERMAREDSLTGISNRRNMVSRIDAAIDLAERSHIPLAVIYLDVDNFKHVNDNFGHARGDEVLINVVETVRNHIRRTDSFGRWGGEEFLVLLQDTSLEGGLLLAEKLRSAVAEQVHIDGERVTCSFGVAEWHRGDSQDQLIGAADSALYLAKNRGKNRVESDINQ